MHAKATKDFSSLTRPAFFVNAYPSVLKEVNRRVLFNKIIREDLNVLNNAIRSEMAERKRFVAECGEGMHETFLDELQQMPQLLSMFKSAKQEQAEMSLPQITDQLALEDVAYLVRYHVDREMLAQDSPDELDEERNLDSVPQKLTSSSRSKAKDGLTKQKLKVLKRQTKELKRINVDLVRQLKEASDLFQDQLNEGNNELKCEKMTQLLRQVCESNYYML